jgi:hypothetical protein
MIMGIGVICIAFGSVKNQEVNPLTNITPDDDLFFPA